MDKKRSLLNVFVGIFGRILIIFASLISRRFLIQFIGNEANGVISLFSSIIGFLAVAELGIGSAISVCMYKPIVDGDTKKVAALYLLFKKLYRVIGIVVFLGGCGVVPFIPFLAKDYALNYNLYLLFFLQLISVVITYFYSANISLINAYKNNYITSLINSICQLCLHVIQIFLLLLTKSLYFYLLASIIIECLHTIILYLHTKKSYKTVLGFKTEKVDKDTSHTVKKNVRALFMHKVGATFVNTIDSLVISTVLGVAILGYYSNYILVVNSVISIIVLFFNQLGSVVGHAYHENNSSTFKKYFLFFYYLNYFIASFSFLGFFACVSPFINLFLGENLLLGNEVLFIITINYFIQFMENAVRLFKDNAGLFYHDRYKSLIEAGINLALSIAFVYWLGVVGVIAATIVTNVLISHIVEPHVLYKYAFHEKETKYVIGNYLLIAIFIGLLFCYFFINNLAFENYFVQLVVNGLIGICFSIPAFLLFFSYAKKEFSFASGVKNCIHI